MHMNAVPQRKLYRLISYAALLIVCFSPFCVQAGPYLESAHGNSAYGVNRSAIDPQYSDFAIGNCGHCHEAHASRQGAEPLPEDGPSAHTLFTNTFDSSRQQNPYLETDNFCFSCHSETSGQQVVNLDYSSAFGGGNVVDGPQSILSAFNLESYHNLYDVWNFLRTNPASFPGFDDNSNPCSACHNSHLAKRNWDSGQAGFPLLSAISRPDAPSSLWGETELMSPYLSYEAPYAIDDSREPAGIGLAGGENTPDYVTFCTICHNEGNAIWSTTLNRELRKVNWTQLGLAPDKHGTLVRAGHPYDFGVSQWVEPYASAALLKSNLVLSCMDCHEAHGSENIMLLRRRVNGGELQEVITDFVDKPLYSLCIRCHNGEYINAFHHEPGAIPDNDVCTTCHPNGEADPTIVTCRNCHFHGSNM